MTAPSPLLGALAQTRLHRVAHDVGDRGPQLGFGFHPLRAETTLEHVTGPVMAIFDLSAVVAMESSHPRAEISLRSLEQVVNVVVHQAIREAPPFRLRD